MPAIGVYAFTPELIDVLMEDYHSITNRDILFERIVGPIQEIEEAFSKGLNTYICIERYRAWVEHVSARVGSFDFPSWKEIHDHGKESECQGDCWHEHLRDNFTQDGDFEWEIFYEPDNADLSTVFNLPLIDSSSGEVCKAMLEAGVSVLLLWCPDFGCVYLLKSTYVDERALCEWPSQQRDHLFEGVADAEEAGDLETYILPPDIQEKVDREVAASAAADQKMREQMDDREVNYR